MIIDCFPFFKELDLLEIRLEELKDVVDWFVLVEASETFSGKPKPFVYELNRERFSSYNICDIKIQSFPPELSSAWDREAYTRNILEAGLNQLNAQPNDLILLSDIDEIPKASQVQSCAASMSSGQEDCCIFEMVLAYYYCNLISDIKWQGTRMTRRGNLSTMQQLRYQKGHVVSDGGWHFSYVGSIGEIQEKIRSISHTENDLPQYTDPDHIAQCMQSGEDLFGREYRFSSVPLDLNFPHHLIRNAEKFSHLIYSSPECPRLTLLYAQAKLQSNDLSHHLSFISCLGGTVRHITELEITTSQTTQAFLYARPDRLVSYAKTEQNTIHILAQAALEAYIDYVPQNPDPCITSIEPTDLLFIDMQQIEVEMDSVLNALVGNVSRYLLIYGTEVKGMSRDKQWNAVCQYMRVHSEWRLTQYFSNNSGLAIFTRMG